MSISLRFGVAIASAAVLMACSGSDGGVSSADDEVAASKPVTAEQVREVFKAVDDNCAGNDNGHLGRFDVATFKASEAMTKLRADDKNAKGVDCSDNRILSTSREEGISLFDEHIKDENETTKSCLEEKLTATQRARLKRLVSDPSNLGVFSSAYGGGNSEGCDYYNFHIYRADGTFLALTFNFTD